MRGGIRMSDLQKYKNKQLQDPEFKAEYERTRPEFEIMHALVDARISQNMTQKELAEKSGIRQSNISRIENGTCKPNHCNPGSPGFRHGQEARCIFRIIRCPEHPDTYENAAQISPGGVFI